MATTDVTLRRARLDDIPALIDLFAAVASERVWIGTEPGFDRDRIHASYMRTIGDPAYLTLVVESGTAIAGSLRLRPEGNRHHLGMHLDTAHRGQGIGTQLMDAAIAWAGAAKSAAIELGVFPHNAAAIRLYEKSGFRMVQRSIAAAQRRSGDVWDVIQMELVL